MLAAAVAGPLGPASAQTSPVVVLEPAAPAVGEQLTIRAEGLSPSRLYTVELCGNGAARGSADCHAPTATTMVSRDGGQLVAQVPVPMLDAGCPCVVRLTTPGAAPVLTPVRIAGIVEVPPSLSRTLPHRSVRVVAASLEVDAGWRSWFGLPTEGVLELTLLNDGEVPLATVPLALATGAGPEPTGYLEAPVVEDLQPGESRRVVVEVPVGPLRTGAVTVVGRVEGFDPPVEVRVGSGTAHPWGLLALAAVVVQIVLIGWRNRYRRRLVAQRREEGRWRTGMAPEVGTVAAADATDATAEGGRRAVPGSPPAPPLAAEAEGWERELEGWLRGAGDAPSEGSRPAFDLDEAEWDAELVRWLADAGPEPLPPPIEVAPGAAAESAPATALERWLTGPDPDAMASGTGPASAQRRAWIQAWYDAARR